MEIPTCKQSRPLVRMGGGSHSSFRLCYDLKQGVWAASSSQLGPQREVQDDSGSGSGQRPVAAARVYCSAPVRGAARPIAADTCGFAAAAGAPQRQRHHQPCGGGRHCWGGGMPVSTRSRDLRPAASTAFPRVQLACGRQAGKVVQDGSHASRNAMLLRTHGQGPASLLHQQVSVKGRNFSGLSDSPGGTAWLGGT